MNYDINSKLVAIAIQMSWLLTNNSCVATEVMEGVSDQPVEATTHSWING